MKWPNLSFIVLLFLLAGSYLTGCAQTPKTGQKWDTIGNNWTQAIAGSFSRQSKAVLDSNRLDLFFFRYPLFNAYAKDIRSFYQRRNYAYAWFENSRMIEQAGNLSNRMLNLPAEGISKTIPYPAILDSLINDKDPKTNVETEFMLTAQYFVFSKLAWQGLSNLQSQATGWYLPRKKVDYQQYLDSLIREPETITAVREPVYRQYDLLRTYLKKYRDLAAGECWLPIVSTVKLKPGDWSAVIPQIKSRLFQLGDFKGDTVDRGFNDTLRSALKQFQGRHGLVQDGLLTKATLSEMNVPLKRRIEQLIVNMERSRWLPVNLHSNYLGVNIAEFKLHVYHGDSLLWSSNVVVGQTMHQTTLFYGEIKYVVFSPYWEVPPSIVRREILPEIKKYPDYLATHQMEITGYKDGLPVIRQMPGPENSLGLVKFLFPNRYNIYLHDTPSKSFFGETARAFSHGCIRVEQPEKLANFLLRDYKSWDSAKISSAMRAGKERYVTLTEKVPVFIAYFTAFIDRDGRLNFRKDIYQLDGALAGMLLSNPGKP